MNLSKAFFSRTLSLCSLVLGLSSCAKQGAPAEDATDAQSDKAGSGKTAALGSGGISEGAQENAPETEGSTQQKAGKQKVKLPPMSAKAQGAYDAGKRSFASADLSGAKNQFKKAIDADSGAYEAYHALGVVEERLGNQGAAVQAYRRASKIAPEYAPVAVSYALLLARQEKHDEALTVLQRASAAGPDPALLAAKSEVKSMQGDSGEAQRLAQEALKLDPSFKPAMVALARDHYRARRIDLALYALTGILDGYGEGNPPRDKNNAEARLIRGLIYAERGLRGPAMEEMERALRNRPDLVDAHLVLANYMMEAGNAQDARKHLEQAIRFDNKNVGAHLQLGDAYRLLGKTEDARREFQWVLAADPNQAAAHYNLGLLYLLSKSVQGLSPIQTVDKAIEHLEAYKARGVRGGPDDVDDLITRAKTNKALLEAQKEEG